ncbi:MAG TPA: hypothetical protein VIZ18_03745 [Ktedonobacteraceae bacterium]
MATSFQGTRAQGKEARRLLHQFGDGHTGRQVVGGEPCSLAELGEGVAGLLGTGAGQRMGGQPAAQSSRGPGQFRQDRARPAAFFVGQRTHYIQQLAQREARLWVVFPPRMQRPERFMGVDGTTEHRFGRSWRQAQQQYLPHHTAQHLVPAVLLGVPHTIGLRHFGVSLKIGLVVGLLFFEHLLHMSHVFSRGRCPIPERDHFSQGHRLVGRERQEDLPELAQMFWGKANSCSHARRQRCQSVTRCRHRSRTVCSLSQVESRPVLRQQHLHVPLEQVAQPCPRLCIAMDQSHTARTESAGIGG